MRNSQFSSASLYCESDDQNLSKLATFIIQQLRRHGRASLESYFKSHAIEIRFLWHRSIFKSKNSVKCASDLFLPAHDGASTSNHGLCSMNGNRSLRCGVID